MVKEGIVQFYLDGVDIGSIDLSKNQGHQEALHSGLLAAGEDDEPYLEYTPTETGNFKLSAVYEGTAVYKSSNSTTDFIVGDEAIDTALSAPDVTTSYNEGKELVATLKDADGKVIDGAEVRIVWGDVDKTLTTDSNGQVSLSTDGLDPDIYIADITFAGDDIYNPSSTTAKVTVSKLDTILTAEYDADSKNIVATLKDADDNPISGIIVGFDIDGMKYIITEADGQAKYSTRGLAEKAYSVDVIAQGNNIYKDSNKVTVKFDLNRISTILTASDVVTDYNGGKYFTATLKDVNGKAVKDAMVTLQIGSVTRVLYTDANGQVSLTTDGLVPDIYTATATFGGDDTYKNSSATAKVTVNKLDIILTAEYDANSKNIVATVKDAKGNPVSGIKVGFALDGVKYVTTDANGQALYSTKDLADKVYTVSVMAYGNEIYNDSNKVTVKFGDKQKSKIFLRNALYFVLQTKMVQLTLWDANNNPIAGKTVYINLDEYGLKYSGVTDENGNAYIRVGVGFGNHPATVSFEGDDQYAADTKTGRVRVIKETPSLMLPGKYVKFKASDTTKTVKIYLKDRYNKPLLPDTRVFIRVNGQTHAGQINKEGIASINININAAGTYNAELIYMGNTAYNKVTRQTKITIV